MGNIAAVGALKESDGPDLLRGSSTLYSPLLAAGLIDELVLMTFPVVLGTDKRLFDDGIPPGVFRLLDQQITTKDVIVTRWAPGWSSSDGQPSSPSTSAAEAECQRRMKEGTWQLSDHRYPTLVEDDPPPAILAVLPGSSHRTHIHNRISRLDLSIDL